MSLELSGLRGWVFTGPAQIATAPVRVIILTLAGAVLKRYKSNFNIKSHVYITDLLGLSIIEVTPVTRL